MKSKSAIIVPVIIMVVGIAALLNVYEILPGVDWAWTLCLLVVGFITLYVGKLNRLSFVVGGFLIVAAIFSLLRQTGRLRIDVEVPFLIIILGALLLAAHFLNLSEPGWISPKNNQKQN